MQHFFKDFVYDALVANTTRTTRLKALRQAAGLSQRELAQAIGEIHSNVNYWENGGRFPRSDVLIPMAKALGVRVEELLGEPNPKRNISLGGKLGQAFAAIARLPRRRQEQILKVINALVAQAVSANGH